MSILNSLSSRKCNPDVWDAKKWLKSFMPIWDSHDRYEQHRIRSQYYQEHIKVVEKGYYISKNGKKVNIPWDPQKMTKRSKMYKHEMHVSIPQKTYDTKIEVWQMDCLDAAKVIQQTDNGITAVLNLANRQTPGGGVLTGSGAQEESCFLRSDYFTAMYHFTDYADQYNLPSSENQYPLDKNFGGVWSEDITIFRGRELEGYPLLDEPWKANFIAVAGLNRPPVVEENGELRLTEEMVQATLNKIRTIFNIAIDNNVSNLVLGALGCGAFKNPPKHIAELFKQVLNEPEYKGRFSHVVFAILGKDLCEVFNKCFAM